MPKQKIAINVRFLLISFGALVVTGALVHLAYSVQWQRNSAALMERADQAQEEGKTDRVLRFLGQYVMRNPADAESLARFGLLLDHEAKSPGARRQARAALEQVLIRDSSRTDVRRRLALLAVGDNDFETARPHLEMLLQGEVEDAELEYALGRCQEADRRMPEAAKHYQAAIKHDPARVEAYAQLVDVLRGPLNKPQEADKIVARMVEANPKSVQAYLARSHYFQTQPALDATTKAQALERAGKDMDVALKLAPDDLNVLFAAAELAQLTGEDLDKARRFLHRILEKYPKAVPAYQSLAALEGRAGRPEESVKWLKAGLQAVPEQSGLTWTLTNLLLQTGKTDEARGLLDQLAKMELGPGQLELLQATLKAREGNWLEASRILEQIRPFFKDVNQLIIQTDFLLAECYAGLGDPERSLVSLRRVTALDPLQTRARAAIASTLLQMGRMDEALGEYQQVMDAPQAPAEGWATMTRLLIAQNLRLNPAQRQWDRVDQALDRAEKAKLPPAEITILRSQALLARGDTDKARALLLDARAREPKQLVFWLALADLEDRAGKPDTVEAVLNEAEKQLGDSASLRLARIGVVLGRGPKDALERLKSLGTGLDRFSDQDRGRLLSALADAAFQLKDSAGARRLWNQLAELEPGNLNVRLILFELALQDNDEQAARQMLQAVQQVEGASRPLGMYSEARFLIWRAERGDKSVLKDARSLLVAVDSRRPGWSRVPLAQAQIDELENNTNRAVENYLKAVELGEKELGPIRRLMQLLYEQHRYAEADLILRRLPEQVVLSGNLQQMAAEASLQTRDYARALELARRVVPTDSKDYRDHVWLGQVLWAAGKTDEAEASLRRAITLAETKAAPWVALVQFLGRTQQLDKANKAIELAKARIVPEEAALALGECYLALNRLEEARTYYQTALKEKSEDVATLQTGADFYLRTNQMKEAEDCLRRVVALKGKDPAAALRAQRILAIVLASGGNYQRSREALAILGLGGEGQEPPEGTAAGTIEEQRARAVVLASQRGREYTRQAVRLLEALDQRQPLISEDQFLLVQLYDRLGETQKFRDRLQRLLAANPDSPRYLSYQVGILLRQKNYTEAETWQARLEALAPDAQGVVELRARLLAAQGRTPEAVALIKQKIPLKEAATVLTVANLLESLGQAGPAEEDFRRFVTQAKQPEAALLFAQFLGRHNRAAEALDLCDQAWKTCSPEAVGYACLQILSRGAPTAEHCRRVRAGLEQALRKDEKQIRLLGFMAKVAEIQEHFDEADALYRKTLEKDPRNPQALNNLAWLLAMRGQSLPEALRLVNQAIEVMGPIASLLDTRAVIFLAMGQPATAIPDLEEAAASPGLDAQTGAAVAFHLARALDSAGKRDEAVKALARGRSLGLDASVLHPLEKAAYQEMSSKLSAGS